MHVKNTEPSTVYMWSSIIIILERVQNNICTIYKAAFKRTSRSEYIDCEEIYVLFYCPPVSKMLSAEERKLISATVSATNFYGIKLL